MKIKIFEEEKYFEVRFEYSEEVVLKLKAIGCGRWQPELKCWQFPLSKLNELNFLKGKLEDSCRYLSEQEYVNEISKLKNYLIQKGYSPKTLKNYVGHLERYLKFSKGEIDKLSIDQYVVFLLEAKNSSHTYANQAINAIKSYLKSIGKLNKVQIDEIVRPKREYKLPKVMSMEEVKKVIEVTENIKHKTMIMMAYSCGLRVSEVAEMKIKNIDSSRMLVLINQGKGRKDRITSLSIKMLEQLRTYYQLYNPRDWLFESTDIKNHIHTRSIQKVFNNAVEKAGIHKELSFHSLRHSYATHMLESGVDLRYIQELLGHNSSKTTEIYTHVSTKSLSKIPNPLDQL